MAKAYLVTGASSGIGLDLSKYLAELGHTIYATVRKQTDYDRLETIENIMPMMVDVSNPQQIAEARAFIDEQGAGLDGLINNAGLGHLGYLHTFTEAEMKLLLDVNIHGPVRMANAFLDLLIASKGRVVNIGSQGGSVSMAFFGPYTMTKHALEAYTVALGEELKSFGVHVSIIQPGGIVTEIFDNGRAPNIERFERAKPPFDEVAKKMIHALNQPIEFDASQPESASNRNPSSTDIVNQAAHHALFSDTPKTRYLVGTRWEGGRVINMLIERLLDANDCPSLQYSKEELFEKIEAHMGNRNDSRW